MPGRSMNVITPEVMEELNQIVDKVAADEAVKGCVITSGKESFSGGAGLTMLRGPARSLCEARQGEGRGDRAPDLLRREPQALAALSQARDLRKTLRGGDPWRLPGRCLRTLARLPVSRRLGRCLDPRRPARDQGFEQLAPAAPVLVAPWSRLLVFHRQSIAKERCPGALPARSFGLVRAVAARADIVQNAKDWLKANPQATAGSGHKQPSGKVHSPAGMQIWPPANAIYRRETNDNYPAARAILCAVYEGLRLPISPSRSRAAISPRSCGRRRLR